MRGEPELLPQRARRARARARDRARRGVPRVGAVPVQPRRPRAAAQRTSARALVRAPMSAQAHELAGEDPRRDRRHRRGAPALRDRARPRSGRARRSIDTDLARLDALEGKWDDADARIAALLADPDPSIAAARARGQVANGGLARRPRGAARGIAARSSSAVSPNAANIFDGIGEFETGGKLNAEMWTRALNLSVHSRE